LRLYQLTGHAPYLEVARQLLEQRGRMPLPSFSFSLIRQLRSSASRLSAINKQRQDYISNHPGYTIKLLPPGNESKSPPNSTLRWLVNSLSGKYLQQHAPIREQTVPVGHSVRFGYLETAIARLYRLTGDESLIPTLEEAWERMVRRRMYITGGLGSVPRLEGFGRDYELDPEYAYAETCAALASLFWNWEMSLATGNARYSDLFEWQLYNAAAVGMGLSGTDYFYNNPLVCTGGFTRKPWYAVPCCPSNLSRTWADLGKYIYTVDDDKIWIHQYVGNATSMNTGQDVEITMESGFPWHGGVKIILKPLTPVNLTLYARLPSWASIERTSNTVKINGQSYDATAHQISTSSNDSEGPNLGYDPTKSHFLPIQRLWSPGDVLELDFGMPVTLRRAHPKVKGHRRKVAVTRGPLVYCLESVDNPELDIFSAILDPHSLQSSWEPQLLGGIMLLHGRTMNGEPLVFIPYHLLANRGESKMTVWVYCAS
jgi:DUF1680 family protein